MNKSIKSLNLFNEFEEERKQEFLSHFGLWTKNDENDFKNLIKDLEKLNEKDWR